MHMLRRLGPEDALERRGTWWTDSQFCRDDDTAVGRIAPSSPAAPIDYLGIHRADLLDMLLSPVSEGIVHSGPSLRRLRAGRRLTTAIFATGERVAGDVMVDGIRAGCES